MLSQQNGHIRSSSRMGKIHSWNIPCSCKSLLTVYDRISVRVGELLCITSKRIYLPQRFISHIRIDYMRFSLWESVYIPIEKKIWYESQSTHDDREEDNVIWESVHRDGNKKIHRQSTILRTATMFYEIRSTAEYLCDN